MFAVVYCLDVRLVLEQGLQNVQVPPGCCCDEWSLAAAGIPWPLHPLRSVQVYLTIEQQLDYVMSIGFHSLKQYSRVDRLLSEVFALD